MQILEKSRNNGCIPLGRIIRLLPWLHPLDTKNTPFSISITDGECCWRDGLQPCAACDSLTCTLIGSSRNLLSWMQCTGIGSSLHRALTHQQTGREAEREEARGCPARHLERRRRERTEGEYPVSSSVLCHCSPHPCLLRPIILFTHLFLAAAPAAP